MLIFCGQGNGVLVSLELAPISFVKFEDFSLGFSGDMGFKIIICNYHVMIRLAKYWGGLRMDL